MKNNELQKSLSKEGLGKVFESLRLLAGEVLDLPARVFPLKRRSEDGEVKKISTPWAKLTLAERKVHYFVKTS